MQEKSWMHQTKLEVVDTAQESRHKTNALEKQLLNLNLKKHGVP